MVETTGVADPLPVALTFLRSEFRDLVRVDSIVTVADAGSFCLDLFESKAARNQLRYGDVVLLNKCDLVGAERLAALEEEIRALEGGRADPPHDAVPGCAPAHPQRRPVPVGPVLRRSGHAGRGRRHDHAAAHDHDHISRRMASSRFRSRASGRSPSTSFRISSSGFPTTSIAPRACSALAESDQRYIFHLVARRFSLDASERDGPTTNKLVLIGRNLDRDELRRELEACLAPVPSSVASW